MSDSLLKTKLGKYTLEEKLGSGGMGAVYRSTHPQLNRPVAIKIILETAPSDARQRFLREAQMAMQLSHPHIVRVFDVDEQDGMPYIVMEFIDGSSLDDILKKDKVTHAQALEITTELADALEYAHKQGILHRDIKPANVLLRKNGSAVLVDLGLARLQETNQGEHLTQTGMIVGTVAYMAPEQIQTQPLDNRTDIYALGVLLYQMVTKKLPFEGTTTQVMFGHVYTPPTLPTMLDKQIPHELEHLIKQMLAKEPDQRPQSMAEVAKRLRAIDLNALQQRQVAPTMAMPNQTQRIDQSASRPAVPSHPSQPQIMPNVPPSVHTSKPAMMQGMQPHIRQQPQNVAVPSAPSYAPVQPSNQYPSQPSFPAVAPIQPPQTQPKQRSSLVWIIAGVLALALLGGGIYLFTKQDLGNGTPTTVALQTTIPDTPTESADTPTLAVQPPNQNNADLEIANVYPLPFIGEDSTVFNGTLTNNGDTWADTVVIKVSLRDNAGNELDYAEGGIPVLSLPPQRKIGWRVIFNRKLPEYDHVEVIANSRSAGVFQKSVDPDIQINEGHQLVEDGIFKSVKGTVTNTGTDPVESIQVVVTGYDAKGNALDVQVGLADGDALAPNATTSFEIPFLLIKKYDEIVSYDIFVQGVTTK